MQLDLQKLQHIFTQKPLLVGGKAMEYYGLRKAGADIDLIAPEEDIVALMKRYPNRIKDLWGDIGVCPFEFEIWRTIGFLGYEELKEGSIDISEVLVISLEKLLVMKALAMKKEKNLKDTYLLVEEITKRQYMDYDQKRAHIDELLQEVQEIMYIEKTGPEKK